MLNGLCGTLFQNDGDQIADAVAATLTVTLQSFVYAYANLGYGLWDTLSFPFLSRGTTALQLDALLLGLMLGALRTGAWVRDLQQPQRTIQLLRIER